MRPQRYFIIIINYRNFSPKIYCGERGGLAPSLFLGITAAKKEKRSIQDKWPQGYLRIVELVASGQKERQ